MPSLFSKHRLLVVLKPQILQPTNFMDRNDLAYGTLARGAMNVNEDLKKIKLCKDSVCHNFTACFKRLETG